MRLWTIALLTTWFAMGTLCAAAQEVAQDGSTVRPYEFRTHGDERTVAAEWGTLEVPAHHGDPDGPTIELAYVRFPSTNPEPGDPIVYLAGGPGGSGIQTARGRRFPLFMALREVADVIAFDQRGTDASSPAPRCRAGDAFPLSKPVVRAEAVAYVQGVARRCLEEWREQGVDLSVFTTRESAHDLEALRRALGARRLNLWGISYGTHLALDAYRVLGPERIRRAVLASPEGLTQTVKLPAYSDRYFERLAALAAESHPEFLPKLRKQIERLKAAPAPIEFTPEGAAEPVTLRLGPIGYRSLLAFGMVKNPSDAARLPGLVDGIEQAGFGILAPTLMRLVGEPMSLSPMSFGMDVASGITPDRAKLVAKQAETAILGDVLNYPLPHVLGVEGLPDLGDDFRREVESDIETLVLTGTLDGRTFPEEHAEILEGLTSGRQIVVENAGHDLFMVSPAVQEAVVRFLRDGTVAAPRIAIDPPAFE